MMYELYFVNLMNSMQYTLHVQIILYYTIEWIYSLAYSADEKEKTDKITERISFTQSVLADQSFHPLSLINSISSLTPNQLIHLHFFFKSSIHTHQAALTQSIGSPTHSQSAKTFNPSITESCNPTSLFFSFLSHSVRQSYNPTFLSLKYPLAVHQSVNQTSPSCSVIHQSLSVNQPFKQGRLRA